MVTGQYGVNGLTVPTIVKGREAEAAQTLHPCTSGTTVRDLIMSHSDALKSLAIVCAARFAT